MWNHDGSQSNLAALRARERRHAIGRLTGRRIARDRGAPRVVAVETEPGVRIHLGATPGTNDDSALGAGDRRIGNAAVRAIDRVDSKSIAVDARAGERP